MRMFNSLQAVSLFAGWPMVIQWLQREDFPGAAALKWVAVLAYAVGFGMLVSCVYCNSKDD